MISHGTGAYAFLAVICLTFIGYAFLTAIKGE